MINKFLISVIALSLVLVTGCGVTGSKQTDGAVLGGVLGGVAGSTIGGGSGRTVAIIGGALLGTILGSNVGAQLDERDKLLSEQAAQKSLEYSKNNTVSTWSNPNTGNSGYTKPVKTYTEADGTPCREYLSVVKIGGKEETAYGTACRQADGQWKIKN